MDEMKRIMIISAHPDDETIGAGGTLAKLSKMGKIMEWCIVTRGDRSDYPEEILLEKKEEALKVADIFNITKVHFLDYITATLDTVPYKELAIKFTKLFQSFRPDTVFMPYKGDMHQDHRKVFNTVIISAKPTPNQSIKHILSYELLSSTDYSPNFPDTTFMPTFFVDISQELDTKINAVKYYKTEMKKYPHARSIEGIIAKAKARGAEIGTHAAEAFMIVRWVWR